MMFFLIAQLALPFELFNKEHFTFNSFTCFKLAIRDFQNKVLKLHCWIKI